jgi:plasmid maintenance system antidote protein VapI
MALRFEKGLGGTATFWLQMQANYDLARAREKVVTRGVTRFAPKVA